MLGTICCADSNCKGCFVKSPKENFSADNLFSTSMHLSPTKSALGPLPFLLGPPKASEPAIVLLPGQSLSVRRGSLPPYPAEAERVGFVAGQSLFVADASNVRKRRARTLFTDCSGLVEAAPPPSRNVRLQEWIVRSSTSLVMAVFDFDCTLTIEHYYHFLNSLHSHVAPAILNLAKDELIRRFFGGIERFSLLVTFLRGLKKEKVLLAIASNGYKDQIYNCLESVGLTELFTSDQIYANERGKKDFCKEVLIKKLLESYHVVYVDDDPADHLSLLPTLMQLKEKEWVHPFSKNGYLFCKGLAKNGSGMNSIQMEAFKRAVQSVLPLP